MNKWGIGVFSDPVNIVSAFKPGQMNAIRSSIEATAGDVVFVWDLPNERGDPISRYDIYFHDNSGNTWQELVHCNGADLAIVTFRTCTVPMQIFRVAPFSLSFNALIVA